MLFADFQMAEKFSNVLIIQFHVIFLFQLEWCQMWIPNEIKEQKITN